MIMRYIKCIYKRVRILFDIDEMKHITTDHEKNVWVELELWKIECSRSIL